MLLRWKSRVYFIAGDPLNYLNGDRSPIRVESCFADHETTRYGMFINILLILIFKYEGVCVYFKAFVYLLKIYSRYLFSLQRRKQDEVCGKNHSHYGLIVICEGILCSMLVGLH